MALTEKSARASKSPLDRCDAVEPFWIFLKYRGVQSIAFDARSNNDGKQRLQKRWTAYKKVLGHATCSLQEQKKLSPVQKSKFHKGTSPLSSRNAVHEG